MQTELDAEQHATVIQILGVDAAGEDAGNADMTAGRELPWLQDTAAVDAWGAWGVTFRDVVLVDPAGRKVGVYNLTEHDLGVRANYEELKTELLAVAPGN